MQQPNIAKAAADLFEWCRSYEFAGHDPFDGLNSRLFQATPLRHVAVARLLWTQLFKRSPVDLRRLALVPKGKNPKGIALFGLATLANHRRLKNEESAGQAKQLLAELLDLKLDRCGGSAWGYNFDWQSRVLYAPRGTPAIVPTAFAVRALVEGALVFEDPVYSTTARTACDFILNDLKLRSGSEVFFAYTPNSQTRVYNASMLGAETLARVGALTGEKVLIDEAIQATRHVVKQQRADGSWPYGAGANQNWVDNFHTAYLLSSLAAIIRYCEGAEGEFEAHLRLGYDFWRTSFFLADGWPKYYHDRLYPVDAHAAAAAIVTLLDFRQMSEEALPLARRVAAWSIINLRDSSGFFFYQRRRFTTLRTPFMRWTQAWMLYALTRLLEEEAVKS